MKVPKQFHLLLADDDQDDRFFFNKALQEVPIPANLTTVKDGENLMRYLSKNSKELPDALFLDLNMPRKNGTECLIEIKSNKILKELPVIIYSTSHPEDVADLLYENGAHYYIRKASFAELEKALQRILTLMIEKKFTRPSRNQFILIFK